MQVLCVDRGEKFISAKLNKSYEKRGIKIKYAAPYIHKKNGIAEKG